MANTPPCSTDSIIENEINFYNWLNTGDKTCPTPQEVYEAIEAAMSPTSSYASSLYYNEETLKKMQKLVEQRKVDVQVAKDRATITTRPELTASYYDGWFPLNRPIKHVSVPILVGLATFLFTVSILLLLELLGITTIFSVTVPLYLFGKGDRNSYTSGPTKIIWFLSFVVFILVMYVFYR